MLSEMAVSMTSDFTIRNRTRNLQRSRDTAVSQLRYIFLLEFFITFHFREPLNLFESVDFQGHRVARSASFFFSNTLFPKGCCTIGLAKCDSNRSPLASFLIFVTGGYM